MLIACHFKYEALARLLARRGATITKQVVDMAKTQGKRKLAKWLRRVCGHATSLHWACEDRDREGLLRRLRSDEYERALPPLAELEAIATHKHAPACEQSVRLLRHAHEPWERILNLVTPQKFGGIKTVPYIACEFASNGRRLRSCDRWELQRSRRSDERATLASYRVRR